MEKENKSKNIIIILLSILIVLLVIGIIIGIMILNSSKNQNNPNNENSTVESRNSSTSYNIENNGAENNNTNRNTAENTINNITSSSASSSVNDTTKSTNQNTTENGNISAINVANVKGVQISVPATKESFAGTGWEWDTKYANNDLATGYTTSGGRIGKYPGGAVAGVVNNSGETKKIQDCTIDSLTFYNPGDGSENVTFIGGLNYNSTADEVKATFSKLGYKNLKERNDDTSAYYTYYLNDDSSKYKDNIEFYFYKGKIESVTIKSSVK